jgi:hypothetical protein
MTCVQLSDFIHSATFAADFRDHLWRSRTLLIVWAPTVISNRSEAAITASSSFKLGRSLKSERMYCRETSVALATAKSRCQPQSVD